MTFNNLFFKKFFVNKTKLQYSRQKIISNRCFFETIKIIRKRNIKTYDIYESQKFLALHHHKTIQQIINAIIEIIQTVQVHNFLYFRKKNDKTNALNRKKRLYENKKKI